MRSSYVYKYRKQNMKEFFQKVAFGRMVSDNLADLIPDPFIIKWDEWGDITIEVDTEKEEFASLAQLNKLLKKLSNALRIEPNKQLDQSNVYAHFHIPMGETRVHVQVFSRNGDPCEIVERRRMRKVFEPTGFCKDFVEQKYL